MPDSAATPASTESLEAFKDLLREIFQYDVADLDFGIYRVLNEKRDDIERFIDEELVEAVHEELAAYETGQVEALEQEVEEAAQNVRANLSEDAIQPDGSLSADWRDSEANIITEYKEARQRLEDASMAETTERRIYDDLTTFFRRYYEDGDFATKRRFAARQAPYYVPYDGQEVFLHWANRDQYYVKTTEHFTDYRFDVPERGLSVHFELVGAQAPQDNNKASDDRYFVLAGEEPVDAEAGNPATCTIRLAYRPISEEEKEALVGRYNREAGESKSRLQRRMLCKALEARIVEHLEETDAPASVRASLAEPKEGKDESPLLGHLKQYIAKNTADYFVHKDLRGFLEGQLEFFIQNEVLELDDVLASGDDVVQQAVSRAQVVKNLGERIIGFLAQIENFQKRLFEKKKFVTETGYCATLDRVPESLYGDILANDEQLSEWRELYQTDEWDETLEWKGDFDRAFLESHPHVMIDTAHFGPGFTDDLTEHLSELDEEGGLEAVVDGLCIEGDNFQALNLLQARYAGDVPCIYIDPPYNTGSGGFLYKDRYQHSSWLSMMASRLELARPLLSSAGSFYASTDGHEHYRLRHLLSNVFGEENELPEIIWQKRSGPPNDRSIGSVHEYIQAFSKNEESVDLNLLERPEEVRARYTNPDNDPRGPWVAGDLSANAKGGRYVESLYFEVVNPETDQRHLPPEGACWRFNQEKMERYIDQGRVFFGKDGEGRPKLKRFLSDVRPGVTVPSIWKDLATNRDARSEMKSLFGENNAFDTPKPVELMKRVVKVATNDGETSLDYFAGSGTLGHAVMNLNRKREDEHRQYILNEMGEHFDTVLLPRLKKVAFSSNWKDGGPQDRSGQPHVIKYHRLESYEDTLNNIEVKQPDEEQKGFLNEFGDYELHYMLSHETRESQTFLAPGAFEKPFNYSLRLRDGMASPEASPVDLVATFDYLIGLRIRSRRAYEHQERRYVVVRGTVEEERGLEKVMVIWRDREGLDLDEERAWAEETLPPASDFDSVYVNGPSHITGAQPTEVPFRQHMDPANEAAP